jgi:hypothetical protein
LTPEPSVEKDEGISDEEDPAELRILLELNEQVSFYLLKNVITIHIINLGILLISCSVDSHYRVVRQNSIRPPKD